MTTTKDSRIRSAAKFFLEGDKKFFVKGVTYGPFKPDTEGNYLGRPEQVDADLALMRQAGLNVVRIYHAPPPWFLDRCTNAGMRVLVTLPWEKHIEFLRERSIRKQIAAAVRTTVSKYPGHPAILGWRIDSVVKCGLAGTIFFTWTDEWSTGGQEITDWAFEIVTRERQPKKAFYTLEEKLGRNDSTLPHRPLPKAPFVSVIVCSYNGGPTLASCLDSLGKLNYPEYEVILVDDGSTDDTSYIAAQFPWVRYLHQSNQGLSHARNTGAAAAKGEVFAYTDSDCMVDPDWLYYLSGTLVSGDYAGVGGPNITPPAQNWIQACVAAAPGGPSHVLLTDTVAEHISG